MANAAMNVQALQSAFQAFTLQSSRLEASYRELQDKVASLNEQLAVSQRAEVRQWQEKERLGNRLVRMLEALPGALIVIDGDGFIRECNSKAPQLLGTPLLGCAWSVIVQREFSRGASRDGELKLKDGRWLSLSRRPLECEPGEILLLADITESRRMAEMLERNERLSGIGEMTARLGHQIRTPLSSALLYSSQLEREGTAAQQAAAKKISRRLRELGAMVEDMLRFAAGARRTGTCIKATELLHEVADAVLPQLDSAAEIRIEVADEALVLVGNRDALKGALSNLVNNAIQACGAKPLIELSALRCAGRVCLTVADNGHGIAADIRSRLFEPFFTTRPQGTGLGLAVVRSVAEAHHGDVLVDSGRRGSSFTICIPDAGTATAIADAALEPATETADV